MAEKFFEITSEYNRCYPDSPNVKTLNQEPMRILSLIGKNKFV